MKNAISELFTKIAAVMPRQSETKESVFAKWPEVFFPAFWDEMLSFAKDPTKAQQVLDELDVLARDGAAVSPEVGRNIMAVMQIARATLRRTDDMKLPGSLMEWATV